MTESVSNSSQEAFTEYSKLGSTKDYRIHVYNLFLCKSLWPESDNWSALLGYKINVNNEPMLVYIE